MTPPAGAPWPMEDNGKVVLGPILLQQATRLSPKSHVQGSKFIDQFQGHFKPETLNFKL